ncbi:MAG: hypothetical protein N2645_07070 [Clostridia bacterium]|nr:hypothetical protein [Clostridia bacterium]
MMNPIPLCTKLQYLKKVVLTVFILSIFLLPSSGYCIGSDTKDSEVKKKIEKILSSSEFKDSEKSKTPLEKLADMLKKLFGDKDEGSDSEKDTTNLPNSDENGNERSYNNSDRQRNHNTDGSDSNGDNGADNNTKPDKKSEGDSSGQSSYEEKGPIIQQQNAGVFQIIGILIIAGFAAIFLFFILRNLRFSRAVQMKKDQDEIAEMILKNPDEIEQKALEFMKNGDFRQGLRFLYVTLLINLNRFNLISIDKSKTNKQYLEELYRGNYWGYDIVKEFTGEFNRCWYGNGKIDGEKFGFWYNQYSLLSKEAKK